MIVVFRKDNKEEQKEEGWKSHTHKTTATDTPAFTLLLGRAARRHPGGPYPDPDTRLGRGQASSRLGGVTADGRRTRTRGRQDFAGPRAAARRNALAAQGRSATAQATQPLPGEPKGQGTCSGGLLGRGVPAPVSADATHGGSRGESRRSDVPHPRSDLSSAGETAYGNTLLSPSPSSFEPLCPLNSESWGAAFVEFNQYMLVFHVIDMII